MPKFRSGGGFWVRMLPPNFVAGVIVHNADTEVVTETEMAESLTGTSGGWAEGLTQYKRVELARMRVAEDDEFYPQALGFSIGQYVTFYLRRGALVPAQYDLLSSAIVQNVRRFKDERKALWVEIACRYGCYIENVAAPALDPSSQQFPGLTFPPIPTNPQVPTAPPAPPDPQVPDIFVPPEQGQ